MITIGNRKIDTNIFLAPLAGCTDLAFRMIACEHGARFCFYEMIDANSLIYMRGQNLEILRTHERDAPIGAQLLGAEPDSMLRAAEKLLGFINPVILDINAACPAKKVIKKRAGSYLLQDPDRLGAIIKRLSSSLPLPITVKIRIGYNSKDEAAITALARRCQDSGASAIFVHGRTRAQGYSGEVDYGLIGAIKRSVTVPVFGIGNILTPERAKMMFDLTGCDGIMVARGSLGNPWIFDHIEQYLAAGRAPQRIDHATKVETLKRHLSYIDRFVDKTLANKAGEMRKVSLWYLHGFSHAAQVRDRICRTKTLPELLKTIDSIAAEPAVIT